MIVYSKNLDIHVGLG